MLKRIAFLARWLTGSALGAQNAADHADHARATPAPAGSAVPAKAPSQILTGLDWGRWPDLQLKGTASDGAYFKGPDCGLCKVPGWTVHRPLW